MPTNPQDRFISHREAVEDRSWRLNFARLDDPSSGFLFDCDQKGMVDRSKLTAAGLANLDDCIAGKGVGRGRIQPIVTRYMKPAVIRCNCGAKLSLHHPWANECECGREYNGSGQMLAPRARWGEETGEVFS